MRYDFIGLQTQVINGIKNPMLTLVGKVTEEDYKFIVLADGKEIKYTIDVVDCTGNFALFAPFDNSVKVVEVFIKIGNKKYYISRLENVTIIKIYKKIMKCIYSFFRGIKKAIILIFKLIKYIFYTLYKGIRLAWKEHHLLIPPSLWGKYFRAIIDKIRYPLDRYPCYSIYNAKEYNKWLKENYVDELVRKFKYNPLISVIIPVYNIDRDLLMECINSILDQTYTNFEICLADDCSTKKETKDALKELEKLDERIKIVYRKKNGHISEATNSAIEIATGEYIAFMDDDDIITKDALYQVVKALNNDKTIDMLYSDEDKMEMDGTLCEPNFKSDFAPDTLLGGNYICHFSVFRKSLLDKVGLLRTECNGAQDFDFVLRYSEVAKNIYHIPKILYHWRKVPGSTAVTVYNKDYAIENGKKAVEDALSRRGLKGKVYTPIKTTHYIVEYEVVGNPKVSIIIPTKDGAKTLRKCLYSIYRKTTYKNFEVIVVDNQSSEEATFELFDYYKENYKNFKVMKANYAFNYSKINNQAVKECDGDFVLLLNNDTEVITPNWIELMVGYAQLKHVGAVGVKLFYPNGTIQHGGIIIGLGGIAQHAFLNYPSDSYGTYGRLLIPYNCSAVTAACLMVSKKKYLEVNGLDEGFEVALNDVDFNLKLLEKGYYNVFLPQVHLTHYESKTRGLDTTSKKYKKYLYECDLFKSKWQEHIDHDRFYNINYSLKKDFYLDKKGKKNN